MHDAMATPTAPSTSHGGSIQVFYQGNGAIRRPTVARAEGIYMWDTAGRRYIDASSDSGPVVSNIGHGNPRVLAAMIEQATKVAYASRRLRERAQ
jgi:adenosylmethionine-8-amino-7-oxononanoate aminotransferase